MSGDPGFSGACRCARTETYAAAGRSRSRWWPPSVPPVAISDSTKDRPARSGNSANARSCTIRSPATISGPKSWAAARSDSNDRLRKHDRSRPITPGRRCRDRAGDLTRRPGSELACLTTSASGSTIAPNTAAAHDGSVSPDNAALNFHDLSGDERDG